MALRHEGNLRTYRRVQAVLCVARGRPVREVVGLTGMSRQAIYEWVGRYLRRRRPGDLSDAPRSGRPAAAGAISDGRILREFAKDPLSLGYRATAWTVPLLAERLAGRYGCAITRRTLRRRMKALGLAWKRPRHAFKDRAGHLGQKKGALSAA
jgi:transposase